MIDHTEMNFMDAYNQSTFIGAAANDKSPRRVILKKDEVNNLNNTKSKVDVSSSIPAVLRTCRICLGEEDEDRENELICPCSCAGTMKDIHINCLREWLNGKKLVYHGERVKSFFWKALECELCK